MAALVVVAVLSAGCSDDVQDLLDSHAPGYEFLDAGPTGLPCASVDLEMSDEDDVGPGYRLGLTADRWVLVQDLTLDRVDSTNHLRVTVHADDGEMLSDVFAGSEWQAAYARDALDQEIELWAGLRADEGSWFLVDLAQMPSGRNGRIFVATCATQEDVDRELAAVADTVDLPSVQAVVDAIISGELTQEDVRAQR